MLEEGENGEAWKQPEGAGAGVLVDLAAEPADELVSSTQPPSPPPVGVVSAASAHVETERDADSRAQHGKLELSLVNFHHANPHWRPHCDQAAFLSQIDTASLRVACMSHLVHTADTRAPAVGSFALPSMAHSFNSLATHAPHTTAGGMVEPSIQEHDESSSSTYMPFYVCDTALSLLFCQSFL